MRSIAAISRMYCPHHIDHLAPLCDLLSAELLTAEEEHMMVAKDYPSLSTQLLSFTDLHPSQLSQKYKAVIHSFPWPKKMIDMWLSLDPTKRLRAIHIPHGHSDKGYYSGTLESYIHQDIVLLYGNRMKKMLEDLRLFSSLSNPIVCGNLRWHYYQKYKNHFDQLAIEKCNKKLDPSKKTILYAPTWYDFEQSSTCFETFPLVLEQLSEKYNLLVKLHPLLKENDIAKVELYHIQAEQKGNVQCLIDYHHIFSLLSLSDIYLGDLSSIGYDFLLFNRPMFFFNPGRKTTDKSLYLHQCGITMDPTKPLLYQIEKGCEEDSYFSNLRMSLARETFSSIDPKKFTQQLLSIL